MAISTSSLFDVFRINLAEDSRYSFSMQVYGDDGGVGFLTFAAEEGLAANEYQGLQILRQIWDAHGYLRNPDGNELSPIIRGDDDVSSVADLEPNGYWNPFDTGSWARLQMAETVYLDGRHTGRTVADDGLVQHAVTHALKQGPYTPTGTTQDVDLKDADVVDYEVEVNTEKLFSINFSFTEADNVTVSNAHLQLPVLALGEWLKTIKTAGDGITGDITFANLSGNRRYTINYGDSQTMVFRVSGYSAPQYDSGAHRGWHLVCSYVHADYTLDLLPLQTHIRNVRQSIPVQADSLRPEIGSDDAPMRSRKMMFAGNYSLLAWNDHLRLRNEVTGIEHPIQGNGVVDVDELDNMTQSEVAGYTPDSNDFWMPSSPTISHVHFRGTPDADVKLHLRRPEVLVPRGNDYPLRVGNLGTANRMVRVYAHWGDRPLLVALGKGQDANMYSTHERDGTGEVVVSLRSRTMLAASTSKEVFGTLPQMDGDARRRILPLGNITAKAEESFTVDAEDIEGVVRIGSSGTTRFQVECGINLLASPGSGWVTVNMELWSRGPRGASETDAQFLAGFEKWIGSPQRMGGTSGAYSQFRFSYDRIYHTQEGHFYALVLHDEVGAVNTSQFKLDNSNHSYVHDGSLTVLWRP